MSQRSVSFFAVVLMLIGLPATRSAADPPVEFTDPVTFFDVNPCTGELHEITVVSDVRLHQHDGQAVVTVQRAGNTDSGYAMHHGVFRFQENGNILSQIFSDNWTRADGSKFKAQGKLVLDLRTNTVRVDQFTLRCIRP